MRAAGLHAVIPVKEPSFGKSRLAPLLDQAGRVALNIALARRTIEVCVETFGANAAIVVTGSAKIAEIALSMRARVLDESPDAGDTGSDTACPASHHSLNAALRAGVEFAQRLGARGVVVVPTDLPLLSTDALSRALAALPCAPGCLLAGDRRQSGTNLLAMLPADPHLIAFGEESLVRHAARARELGYDTRIHVCEQLGLDLDFPADFRYLETQRSWLRFRSTTSTPSASHSDSIPT